MNTAHRLKQSVHFLRDATVKRLVKQFDAKYHLVYFGHVDTREDDHQFIRGITASATHTDNHYSVGVVNGHDITLVQRRNALTFPGKPPRDYKWLIMQFDLKRGGLPHIFIDANHHDETFFANMFVAFAQFENITPTLMHYDSNFTTHFKVFTNKHNLAEAVHVVQGPIAITLTQHFKQFDYEINDDTLCIYASNTMLTPLLLHEMLRAGLWLADQLNHWQPRVVEN